jgi:hypothetical protein
MYCSEKKELPSWAAILQGWTDKKVKPSEEAFKSLSKSIHDCLLSHLAVVPQSGAKD